MGRGKRSGVGREGGARLSVHQGWSGPLGLAFAENVLAAGVGARIYDPYLIAEAEVTKDKFLKAADMLGRTVELELSDGRTIRACVADGHLNAIAPGEVGFDLSNGETVPSSAVVSVRLAPLTIHRSRVSALAQSR